MNPFSSGPALDQYNMVCSRQSAVTVLCRVSCYNEPCIPSQKSVKPLTRQLECSCGKGCGVLESSTVAGMAVDQCVQPMDEHRTVEPEGFRRKIDLKPRRSVSDTHSLASVAQHNKPNDCWVIIREKVYNVTAWVPQHPGGALIYINAGKDCTQLFDSYHPLYVRYIQ